MAHLHTKRSIAVLFSLALVLAIFPPGMAAAQGSPMRIWVVSDCDKIQRYQTPWISSAVWSESSGRVSLHGGRNEYLGFQIMVTAEGTDLGGVNAGMTQITGPASITGSNIQFFREHYFNVTEPSSSMYGELSTTGPGWYPDPLVPFSAPDGGAPFDIASGCNQGIWVDVYVPEDAPTGFYTGSITVTANNAPSAFIPVDLEVWDFSLPRESHLPAFFMFQPDELAEAHGVYKYDDQYLGIETEYARMARAHRFDASTSIYPEVTGTGTATTIIWDSWHDELASRHLDGTIFPDGRGEMLYALPISRQFPDPSEHGGMGSQEYEDTFITMLRQFRDHFIEKSWFDRSFLYIVDEPNTAEAYDLVRYYGGLIDRSGTGFPFMVSEGPTPQEEAWGSLIGYVDIWCCGWIAWPGPMHERQAAGEHGWTYNGGEPYAGSQIIDTSGVGPRTWAWIARRYGIECWLYWEVCYFHDIYNGCDWNDVWSDPLSFDSRRGSGPWPDWGNGDGTWFYPGTPRGIFGPISSIRMKSWRRGAQDYEYMWLLDQQGKQSLADTIDQRIIPYAYGDAEGRDTSWSKDSITWEEARAEMGRELSAFAGYENRYYFAEGYSGSGFHTWLCFGNSQGVPARTRVTYLYNGGSPAERYLTLPPLSRTTLYVNSDVGPGREFSMVVEAELPIVCERPMYFNYQGQ
jgi:Glycoside hydrolase 123, catalytic domain/Glycoside hydrolase 123 N-terminal domain